MNLLEIMKKNADNAKTYITNTLTNKLDKTTYNAFINNISKTDIDNLWGNPTTITDTTKIIVNNKMTSMDLVINGVTYTFMPHNNIIIFFDNDYFYIFSSYHDNMTAPKFRMYGALSMFFYQHKLTVTRESDGYGLLWAFPDEIGNDSDAGVAVWSYDSASAASTTTDTVDIIKTNLSTAYSNGENLILEFSPN